MSVTVLSGGVGGAKLALGLDRVLPKGALSLVINTGDDFDHLGLRVCPDLDTALYTLSGLSDRERGWGRAGETWHFMEALGALGGETWFALGDKDLALQVERTRRLATGDTLSSFSADLAERLGVATRLSPMSDDKVATMVETDEGILSFQDYFVRRACEPRVVGLRFAGAEQARASAGAMAALISPELEAIVIAPSNPYLSIDPILAVAGFRDALRAARVPVIAVTPILAGKAVKGPTAKIMSELGLEGSAVEVARHYDGLIDGFLFDVRDGDLQPSFDVPAASADTLMQTEEDKERVARAVLAFARKLSK